MLRVSPSAESHPLPPPPPSFRPSVLPSVLPSFPPPPSLPTSLLLLYPFLLQLLLQGCRHRGWICKPRCISLTGASPVSALGDRPPPSPPVISITLSSVCWSPRGKALPQTGPLSPKLHTPNVFPTGVSGPWTQVASLSLEAFTGGFWASSAPSSPEGFQKAHTTGCSLSSTCVLPALVGLNKPCLFVC